jgi:methyl-accepting chemotaxis protein
MTQTQTESKPGIYLSLRYKLLIGFTLLFTVIFATVYFWFYQFATDMALNQIRDDMVQTLNGAAAGINIEAFKDMAAAAESGTTSPFYDEHIQWLATVREVEPRGVTYTFVPTGDGYEVLFIGDVTVAFNPAGAANLGESYDASPQNTMLYAGLSDLTTNLVSYTDKFGRWVSAYEPLVDSDGKVVGGIGIDFRADYIDTVQQAIINSMVVAFLVTYLILFATVWLVSSIFTQPILKLTGMAERVGEGNYDQDFSTLRRAQFRDEISTLAGVFTIMVGKVRQREEKLKQQVAELKIEIDDTKRQKQVNEIVETDFFQDLQVKARAMRKRGAKQKPTVIEEG